MISVADLHCDLLFHLAKDSSHTPYDLAVRCAIPQLQQGGVKLQTMAIFTETVPGSSSLGKGQLAKFQELTTKYGDTFIAVKGNAQLDALQEGKKIGILPAIENASALCAEGENLEEALRQATKSQKKIGKFLYISLTWNTENRFFGGGAFTDVGLKSDGEHFLDYMAELGIAVDFSHTSDRLAEGIFNYIDKKGLPLKVLASHSNFRAVLNHPRNLSDPIAKEILRRKGIIGFCFAKTFVGEPEKVFFAKHLLHLISLNGSLQGALGADFFNEADIPPAYRKPDGQFFKGFDNASCYPHLFKLWQESLWISEESIKNFAWNNCLSFLKSNSP